MKHNMNRILTTMALLVLTTMTAWAEQKVNVTVTPANSGSVTYAVSNGVCTLTAKPADGYYITVDNLKAVATLDGGAVQSPRRRIDVVDGTELEVTPATGDDPSGTTTYTIAMPEDANLNVEVTAEFQARTSIEGATVTVVVPEGGIIYTGEEQKPAIASVVLPSGVTLTSTDYTVAYSNNINVGNNAEATVVGQGKYKGSATGTFSIGKAVATVTKAPEALNPTYTGSALNLVTAGETENGKVVYSLSADGEFSETIPQAMNAGSYTVYYKATGDANHSESAVGNVAATIVKADFSTVTIGAIADQTFTGAEIKPAVTVTFNGKSVSEDEYNVAYSDNVNAGTATVTLTSKDKNFSTAKRKTATFKINPAKATLSFDKTELSAAVNETPEWPVLSNPQGANVAYTSSKPEVAEVDKDGLVTMKTTGETIITAAINDPNYQFTDAKYTLTVTSKAYKLKIDGIVVTEENRKNLFEDESVMFNGVNRLYLTDATIIGIESGLDSLEIYIKGANVIEATGDNYAIRDLTPLLTQNLRFITDNTNPGSLQLLSENSIVFGFDTITVEKPLVVETSPDGLELNSQEAYYARIAVPLNPVVDDENTNKTIDYGDDSGDAGTENLTNIIIDNVLYTLNDTQTPGASDDGFYNGMVVLNSLVSDEDMQNALQLIPSTDDYANAFKGLTIMVPPGSGKIAIKLFTQEGHGICVNIGGLIKKVIQTHGEIIVDIIPYVCPIATYVYIYHVAINSAAATNSHRIGPKPTVSTGVNGLSVSADNVDTPPGAQGDYLSLSRDDIMIPEGGVGHIIVENDKVTDLDGDAFQTMFDNEEMAPKRRAYGNYDITYIDLRGTSITGKEFSREDGPFKDLPVTTFVYLPAGNIVNSPNMVVGSACDELVLGDDYYSFECAEGGFTAAKAVLERPFEADKKKPFYVPFAISNPEDFGTFFEFDELKNDVVEMKKATTVAANTAYYLQAKEGGVENIEAQGVKVEPLEEEPYSGLIGTYMPIALFSDSYVYNNDLKQFEKANFDYASPFEAYLSIYSSEPTLLTHWEGEPAPTAVEAVRTESAETNQWYSLDGRKLQEQPTRKGVYLKNSKKLVVK